MALTGLEPERRTYPAHSPELQAKLVTLFALVAAPVAPLFLLVPREVLLPSVSALCLVLAFSVAIYAWHGGIHYRSARLTFWDLAGAFTFVGFAAGTLSNPESAMQLFGVTTN